ncbi:MAG: hypothetical protein HZB63_08790 [Deltaproteobacteria bacterium]|nr:hypothetical protein [Deltaproteobacteria bacterium]
MRGRMRAAVFPVLLLLVLCAASGCGRKAKPEPLRSAASVSSILLS